MPVQAEAHAIFHASNVISRGRAIRLPVRISSRLFKEVVTITKSGKR
jgi:hypothetical protein